MCYVNFRHGWHEKGSTKPYNTVSKVGELVRVPAGQKPPLLPKPVIIHKSSPHVSAVRSKVPLSYSPPSLSHVNTIYTVSDVKVKDIETDANFVEDEIVTSDDIAQTHNSNLEIIRDTELSEILNSDESCVSEVIHDGTNNSESQFDSNIGIQNLKKDNTSDNIIVCCSSTDTISEELEVNKIVANTWTSIQSSLPTSVTKSHNESSFNSLSKNVSSLYNSSPSELPEGSTDAVMDNKHLVTDRLCSRKLSSMNSISELVRSLHSVRVEPQSFHIEPTESFESYIKGDSKYDCRGISSDHIKGSSDLCNECVDNANNTYLNQSFLHTHEREINNKSKDTVFSKNLDESESQPSLTNCNISQDSCTLQTSTPKLQNGSSSGTELNSVTMRRRDSKTEESVRIASWYEDSDTCRSRTDSIGSGSFEGPGSVRRRISTWFGSFGKGSKQKEKRESCLFYYDHTESNVTTESESDSQRTSQISLNDGNMKNDLQTLPVPKFSSDTSSYYYDQNSSNRSSVSEESLENEQSRLDVGSREGSNIENEIEDPIQRKKRKCFCVANELMTSEKVFIDVLKLICQDFKKFIEDAGKEARNPIIPPSEFNKIISSLPQLLSLNEDLLHDLENRIESWSEIPKIADVIVKKGPFLKLYSTYIQNFEAQTNFLDECYQKYPRFAKALKDFEGSDRCKKLALKHYMLKPIQRIPQYRLLLEDYLSYQDPDSVDYADTQTALHIVCDVANHANRSMKHGVSTL